MSGADLDRSKISGVVSRGALRLFRCNDEIMVRTVLVVDDNDDFRASARALLEAEGFEVIGGAATAAEALEAVRCLGPSIVLVDVRLPDVDGVTLAGALAQFASPPDVVLVSSRDAGVYGPRLLEAPTRGFLAKHELSGRALSRLLAG